MLVENARPDLLVSLLRDEEKLEQFSLMVRFRSSLLNKEDDGHIMDMFQEDLSGLELEWIRFMRHTG